MPVHADDPSSGGATVPAAGAPSGTTSGASSGASSATESTWLGVGSSASASAALSASTMAGGGEVTWGGVLGTGAPIPAPGARFDRFEVIRQLGAGAMGVVMLARDLDLDRQVAIKFLTPRIAAGDEANLRLLREAQAVARLQHPHVVAVHEVGRLGTGVFVVMEYVDGGTLRQWCAAQTRPWQQIVDVYVQAALGLAAAHAHGLVHRDFKPDNALIGRDGRVRVSDFGLVSASDHEPVDQAAPADDVTLTRTGAILGTPAYMAPEQFTGGSVGPAADQFAFCVSLFEALYGKRPFAGNNAFEIFGAIESGSVRALARMDVPSSIHGAIMRGLAKDPGLRHASLDALAQLLRGQTTTMVSGSARSSVTTTPGTIVAVALTATALAAAAVAGVWWLWPEPPPPRPPPPVVEPAPEVVQSPACDLPAALAATWGAASREKLTAQGFDAALLDALDRRVAVLAEGAQKVCDGGVDPAVADEAAACLHHELAATAGVIDVLGDAPSPMLVFRGLDLADALFEPTGCVDTATLLARGRMAWSEQTDAARRSIWRTYAWLLVGDAERAAAAEPELGSVVAQLDDPGVRMLYAVTQARAAFARGDFAGAEGGLRECLTHARTVGDTALEAIVLADLLDLDLRLGRGQAEVQTRVATLRVALGRAPVDMRWYAHSAIARVSAAAGQVAEAETELSAAIGNMGVSRWPRPTQLSGLLLERAGLLAASGRQAEARADVQRATRMLEAAVGRRSVVFGERAISIAGRFLQLGDLPKAREMIDEAQARLQGAPPAVRQSLADALYHFARAESTAGDPAAGARRIGEAIAIVQATGAEERVAAFSIAQAEIELGRGRHEQAGEAAATAAVIAERYPRSTVIDRAWLADARARVALAQGELATASRNMAERLVILETTGGALSLPAAEASAAVGALAVAQGDCEAARAAFEKARRIRERVGAPADESLVDLLAGEAICHARDDEAASARVLLGELAGLDATLVPRAIVEPASAMVEAELALAAGDQTRARAFANQSSAAYRALGPAGEPWARIVDTWIADSLEEEEQPMAKEEPPGAAR